MTSENNSSILLWAVDVFASDLKLQRESAWAIKALCTRHDFQVHPVYVISAPPQDLLERFDQSLYEKLQNEAQDHLNQMIRGIKIKSILPITILEIQKQSVKEQVGAVIGYAQKIHAEMIVASTRAKKGPAKWIFGSFVESLTLQSNVPFLTVNPSWKRRSNFKDILFATDFSDESHEAFQKVLYLAKSMGSRVHLFHKYVSETPPVWTYAAGVMPIYIDPEEEKKQVQYFQSQGKKWEKEAKDFGVSATSEVDSRLGYSVTDGILKKSKAGQYLIAMASRSGSVESTLFGSVAKRIIRESLSPVWIIHPKDLESSHLGQQVESAYKMLDSTAI